MRTIKLPLSEGKEAIVDARDSHLLKWKWSYSGVGYARRGFMLEGKWKNMYLHHAIAGHPITKKEIDHINGNHLDCTRKNLILVTRRENTHNRSYHRKEKCKISRYIGVGRADCISKPWCANISIGKLKEHIGIFNTEIEAHDAYQSRLQEITHAPKN